MKLMLIVFFGAIVSFSVGWWRGYSVGHGKYTEAQTGWMIQHILVRECPDGWTRKVFLPEKDEVDAMSITCSKFLPNPALGLNKNGDPEEK